MLVLSPSNVYQQPPTSHTLPGTSSMPIPVRLYTTPDSLPEPPVAMHSQPAAAIPYTPSSSTSTCGCLSSRRNSCWHGHWSSRIGFPHPYAQPPAHNRHVPTRTSLSSHYSRYRRAYHAQEPAGVVYLSNRPRHCTLRQPHSELTR